MEYRRVPISIGIAREKSLVILLAPKNHGDKEEELKCGRKKAIIVTRPEGCNAGIASVQLEERYGIGILIQCTKDVMTSVVSSLYPGKNLSRGIRMLNRKKDFLPDYSDGKNKRRRDGQKTSEKQD